MRLVETQSHDRQNVATARCDIRLVATTTLCTRRIMSLRVIQPQGPIHVHTCLHVQCFDVDPLRPLLRFWIWIRRAGTRFKEIGKKLSIYTAYRYIVMLTCLVAIEFSRCRLI